MSDQTESASEYAQTLAWLDEAAGKDAYWRVLGDAAAAIRALEEKVEDLEAGEANYVTKLGLYRHDFDKKTAEIAELRADRDRLAGEVERILVQFDEAIARIKDMLEDDDGQAFKEAGKFLLRIKGRDDES